LAVKRHVDGRIRVRRIDPSIEAWRWEDWVTKKSIDPRHQDGTVTVKEHSGWIKA
jgi:hypothetical protein